MTALELIERRQIAQGELLEEVVCLLRQIVKALQEPTTYPASTGGKITVK